MSVLVRNVAILLVISLVMTCITDAANPNEGPARGNGRTKKPTKAPKTKRPTTTTTTTPAPNDVGGQAPVCVTERKEGKPNKKNNRQGKGVKDPPGTGPVFLIQSACNMKLDLLFIIDCSSSVGAQNFQDIITGLDGVITQLSMSEIDGVRVGFITFGTTISHVEPFSSYKTGVLLALHSLAFCDSGTMTHLAIDGAVSLFTSSARPGAIRLAFVITDGRSEKPSKTLKSFNVAKSSDINVAAVGVTREARQTELLDAVTKKLKVFLKDFNQFREKVDNFLDKVCRVIRV